MWQRCPVGSPSPVEGDRQSKQCHEWKWEGMKDSFPETWTTIPIPCPPAEGVSIWKHQWWCSSSIQGCVKRWQVPCLGKRYLIPALPPSSSILSAPFSSCPSAVPELYTNPCFVLLVEIVQTCKSTFFSPSSAWGGGEKMSKCLQLLQPEQSGNPKVISLTLSVPRIWTEGGFHPCKKSQIIPSVLIIFSEQEKTHYFKASLEEWIWQAFIQMNV